MTGPRPTPPNLDAIRAQMAADPFIQDEFRPSAVSITVIRFVPGLLRVEHEDGGLLFQTTNSDDAIDAWIIGYRVQVPGQVEPIDVLAVVADETGKVFTLRRHD